jgi:hypothetical protein
MIVTRQNIVACCPTFAPKSKIALVVGQAPSHQTGVFIVLAGSQR